MDCDAPVTTLTMFRGLLHRVELPRGRATDWMTPPGHFHSPCSGVLWVSSVSGVRPAPVATWNPVLSWMGEAAEGKGRKQVRRNLLYTGFKVSNFEETNLGWACLCCCNSVKAQWLFIFFLRRYERSSWPPFLERKRLSGWKPVVKPAQSCFLDSFHPGSNNLWTSRLLINLFSDLLYHCSFHVPC